MASTSSYYSSQWLRNIAKYYGNNSSNGSNGGKYSFPPFSSTPTVPARFHNIKIEIYKSSIVLTVKFSGHKDHMFLFYFGSRLKRRFMQKEIVEGIKSIFRETYNIDNVYVSEDYIIIEFNDAWKILYNSHIMLDLRKQ